MFFWLQHGDVRYDLGEGQCVIGRSRDADVMLKDKLVSRRHARILRQADEVTIEDLSSGNGVFVNGRQILGPTPLKPGDTLFVGRNRLELGSGSHPPDAAERGPRRSIADDEAQSTRRQDALDLLGGLAESALRLGRLEQAEATLATYLNNFLQNARSPDALASLNSEKAAEYALRLAEATRKGSWIDYVCQLYTLVGRPLPDKLIDTLERVLVGVHPENAGAIPQYVAALRAIEPRFDEDELRRLERLAALARP
jgi:predicted component of type VI protein secretion system